MSSALRLSILAVMLMAASAIGLFMYSATLKPMAVINDVPRPLMVNYMVAAHPLPAGTLAREEDFTTREAVNLPPGAITDSPDARIGLRGSLVRRFLETGATVTALDILRPRDRGFLASVLAPGSRAVSIAVDDVSGVSGLIWPGDAVDVVLTHDIENVDKAHRTLSETILSNVRIIAIDQEIVQGVPANPGAAGKVAKTATLQVLPEEVERVTVAQHIGKLTLAIRSATETAGTLNTTGTYSGDVSSALSSPGRTATVAVFENGALKAWSFQPSGGVTNEQH